MKRTVLLTRREMAKAIIEASKHHQEHPVDWAYTTAVARELDWTQKVLVVKQAERIIEAIERECNPIMLHGWGTVAVTADKWQDIKNRIKKEAGGK